MTDIAVLRADWRALLPDGAGAPQTGSALTLSRGQWRSRLPPAAFQVLRAEGTERPWSSALNDEKRAGVFLCAGCDAPLFSSQTKFDSGTGRHA